jgi:hypothetical protein
MSASAKRGWQFDRCAGGGDGPAGARAEPGDGAGGRREDDCVRAAGPSRGSLAAARQARRWRLALALAALALAVLPARAQIITTVAGNGTPGFSGDGGPATLAQLGGGPGSSGVAIDSAGNFYIADTYNNRIRKVDAATGIINTVAGSAGSGYCGDGGPATSACLYAPYSLLLDAAGDMYIADTGNFRIRKVSAASGSISTVAGDGVQGYGGDGGPATSAELNEAVWVAVDSAGDLYIADQLNSRIREVAAVSGIITTFAGDGTPGYSGDGGPATDAELWDPYAVMPDSGGNFYIADSVNNRVRVVSGATGIITTVAGDGVAGYSGDGGPATSAELGSPDALTRDSAGNIYISSDTCACVRRLAAGTGIITTVAGDGTWGYSGDGGPATSAELADPDQTACDLHGDLYVTDSDNMRVRMVTSLCSVATATSLSLTSSLNPSAYGEAVTFTAAVSPNSGPTGAVTFSADGTTLAGCGAVGLSGGAAECAAATLGAGSHAIAATYSGDSRYGGSSAALTQVVAQAVLAVSANNQSMVQGGAVPALTYTMTGFMNGDTQATCCTGAPVLSTTATSSSPPGTYAITINQGTLAAANYSFQFVNGTLTVTAPVAGDFRIGVVPAMQIVKGGGAAAYSVTVTSENGFAGPVALTCAGAPGDGTCSFGQATLTLTANGTAQTTMTVTTTSADAALFRSRGDSFTAQAQRRREGQHNGTERQGDQAVGGSQELRARTPSHPFGRLSPGPFVFFSCLSLCICVSVVDIPRKWPRRLPLALVLLALAAGFLSCGCPSTQHQVYTITITGTSGISSPPITRSATVSLVVD